MIILDIATHRRTEFVDITDRIRQAVQQSGVASGLCTIFCPHTTAGVTIQEHADPDVAHDILLWLNAHVPQQMRGFRHGEGNSDAHIKSALIGSSVTIIIEDGRIALGTWQGIFLCEFDGPRRRNVWIQIR